MMQLCFLLIADVFLISMCPRSSVMKKSVLKKRDYLGILEKMVMNTGVYGK